MKRDRALTLFGITKHQYYYKPAKKRSKKGRNPSQTTQQIGPNGAINSVNNEHVVNKIIDIKSIPDNDYGYRAMTAELQLHGFIINHKKVYRLMRKYQLLNDPAVKQERNYVKFRRVQPKSPLEVMEMDIKYQWVTTHERYAFILTAIDCFTRKVLAWKVAYSIKQQQVKSLWEEIIVNYLQIHDMLSKNVIIEIRNDNDSRFAAKEVQRFFAENQLRQVFTHPYTPQENGHIESFHAILSRSLKRSVFETINELELRLEHFYDNYNNIRLHGSLDHLSPSMFWHLWQKNLITSKMNRKKQIIYKLNVPHYQLSGNMNLKGSILQCSQYPKKEVYGAKTLQQPSV